MKKPDPCGVETRPRPEDLPCCDHSRLSSLHDIRKTASFKTGQLCYASLSPELT
jgi:hypothetical protein